MSDWTPTDEQALVKKIATVLAKGYGTSGNKTVLDIDERVARAVLVAVGPHIAAQALRDAAATQDEESARLREAFRQHNAHRDPNRPPRRPDLNTWSNADEATAHRLRARADKIEKEGR
jgi:NAD(P)H-dependent FMN reductase